MTNIAVLCNYKLLSDRIGGMDYFFWMFDQKCKDDGILIHWFFPNESDYKGYSKMLIISSGSQSIESCFLEYIRENKAVYTHIFTHFIEICTPFFKETKTLTNAAIIAVDHNPRPINGYPLKKRIEKKLKGLLYARYIDTFIAVSADSKKQLIRDFGKIVEDKSIVIFNGLDIDKFRKKKDYSFNGRLIVASHLRKEKGIQDLINAVSIMKRNNIEAFKIDIYGTGPYEAELKDLTAELMLENYFDFKGSIPNLYEIYCQYDFLIHPSHGETFCYSVVESLLSGLPVITTAKQGNVLGLVKEKHNGYLFEAGDISSLSDLLSDIINGNHRMDVFSNKDNNLEALSLEKMVENYIKLLS